MLNTKLKLLFVCSQNRWRSKTAEAVFRKQPLLEVRSAGVSAKARHQISNKDILWADLILCMEDKHKKMIIKKFKNTCPEHSRRIKLPAIKILNIEDKYQYLDPELIEILEEKLAEILNYHI